MTWNLGGLSVDKILGYFEGVHRERGHGLHHVTKRGVWETHMVMIAQTKSL